MGAINPTEINWKSTSANAQLLETVGTHLFKFGGDFRKMGVDTFIPGDGAGFFDFDKDMTSSNGGTGSTTDGNSFASFLLGYPSAVRTSPHLGVDAAQPLHLLLRRLRAGRLARHLEADAQLRPALEHEDGLREEENSFTVGFDPTMTSALSTMTIPADPVAGTPARTVPAG